MKTEIIKTMEIILKLDKKEALWLKRLVQNPLIQTDNIFNEHIEDKNMRELIFNSLEDVHEIRELKINAREYVK